MSALETTKNETISLIQTTLSKTFETLLNQALKLDDDQGNGFNVLDEKVVQVTFTDLKQTFFLIYQAPEQAQNTGEFVVQSHLMGQADSHLKTNIIDWIQHNTQAEPEDSVGQTFLQAAHAIEIDWEEGLSKMTGDMVAFKVGSWVRTGQQKAQSTKQKVGDTLEEYLHFEANLLPTQSQVNRFSKQVQQTAQTVEALEARIQALLQPDNSVK